MVRSTTFRQTTGKKPKLAELQKQSEGFAQSFDGVKIWYKSTGQGLPIIFCNGLGCSLHFFKHVHSFLQRKFRCIQFDWRCHGRSESTNLPENITIDALAADLKAVLDTLKVKKAIIIGHSMGAQVLYRFYDLYPDRVMALIPCCGTFGHALDTFYNSPSSKYVFAGIYIFNNLFPKLANTIGYLISKNPFWWEMGIVLQMLNPGLADKKILKEYIEHFTSLDSVMLATLAKSTQDVDAEPILKRIKVPTLIIAADRDKFTPMWLSKKMHHLIPYSEIMVIKKASHVALIEQPALINMRIEKFIEERVG